MTQKWGTRMVELSQALLLKTFQMIGFVLSVGLAKINLNQYKATPPGLNQEMMD
jgi:hypothetical protein